MADDQQQGDQQDETQDDEQQDGTGKDDAARGGDADKPGAALLKALDEERAARRQERDRANKAEASLRKIDAEKRQAETERAIKAGDLEAVIKTKDADLAERDARIAELEAQIATRDLDLLRERIGAKYGLLPKAVAVLKGGTEAEIEADAKDWKKSMPAPAAGNTELGKGGDRSGKPTDQELVEQLRKSGRYASVG